VRFPAQGQGERRKRPGGKKEKTSMGQNSDGLSTQIRKRREKGKGVILLIGRDRSPFLECVRAKGNLRTKKFQEVIKTTPLPKSL